VSIEEYTAMKSQGTLNGNEVVLSNGMVNPEDYKGSVYVSHFSPEKATGCSGYFDPPGPSIPSTSVDDGWAAASPFSLPFTYCFYGNNYNQVWMNNNGNITFGSGYGTFSSTPFPLAGPAMVAAFWGDFYLTAGGTMHATITPTAAIFNWVSMGYYSNMNDKINTCQIVITNGADPLVIEGNTAIHFADMQWTTGAASSGVGGFGGVPATVGANSGDGINYVQIGRFDHAGVDYDGPSGLNDGVSWLDNKSFYFDFCATGNIAPIALQTAYCDTLQVCAQGGNLQVVFPFTSPEVGQNTHVYIDTALTDLNFYSTQDSIVSSTGSLTVNVNGGLETIGVHTITVVAVDDAVPSDTTSITYFIEVTDGTGLFTPTPEISWAPGCSPVSFSVSGSYDNYLWTETGGGTGASNTSSTYIIDNQHSGNLTLTLGLNGCSFTLDTNVVVNAEPPFNFVGDFQFCSNQLFEQLALGDSLFLSSVNWYSSAAPAVSIGTNFAVNLVGGTYQVVIYDDSGTCPNDTTFTINTVPSPIIFTDTFACDFSYPVMNTFSAGGGMWSSLSPTISFSNALNDNPVISSTLPGVFTVFYEDNVCGETISADINFIPYPTIFDDTIICTSPFLLTGAGHTAFNNEVTWSDASPNVSFAPDNSTFNGTIDINSPGTYLITMTDKKCNNSVTVNITLPVLPTLFEDTIACDGQFEVTGITAPLGVTWSSDDSEISFSNVNSLNPIISSASSGMFEVILTDDQCNTHDTVSIEFISDPQIYVNDTTPCAGVTVLTATGSSQNQSYLWSTGDNTLQTSVSASGSYFIVASNQCGSISDTSIVNIISCDVTIPNIVAMNSNAGNDILSIDFAGITSLSFVIVNRWGNVVFETTDPSIFWDGTDGSLPCESGVYNYLLNATISNGEVLQKQGFIQLIAQ
jgi:hypothetical protein